MYLDLNSLEKSDGFSVHKYRITVAMGQEFPSLASNASCILKKN